MTVQESTTYTSRLRASTSKIAEQVASIQQVADELEAVAPNPDPGPAPEPTPGPDPEPAILIEDTFDGIDRTRLEDLAGYELIAGAPGGLIVEGGALTAMGITSWVSAGPVTSDDIDLTGRWIQNGGAAFGLADPADPTGDYLLLYVHWSSRLRVERRKNGATQMWEFGNPKQRSVSLDVSDGKAFTLRFAEEEQRAAEDTVFNDPITPGMVVVLRSHKEGSDGPKVRTDTLTRFHVMETPDGVLPAPDPDPEPSPEPSPTPAPAPSPSPAPSGDLAPLDLSDMKLWNWQGIWHASQWDNGFSSIDWRFDAVRQDASGDTRFILNRYACPELKAQGGHPYSIKAYYEVDVTLPAEIRPGMCVAPLWTWHDSTKDEIDFEFTPEFLQLTIHSYKTGKHEYTEHRIPGNFQGQRMRLAIRTDLPGGKIEMFVNGKLEHTFTGGDKGFPEGKMRPVMSMWIGDAVGWAESWLGKWAGFKSDNEEILFTIHGYKFEQLS